VNAKPKPIRVLIAEDSRTYSELLVTILQSSPNLQVVGIARDGVEAVRLAKRLKPDVITMDIYMPELDGYGATRQIMEEIPRPIVMISGKLNMNEQKTTFDAIQAGALGVLNKPAADDPPEAHQFLISQIQLLSEVRVVRRWAKPRDSAEAKLRLSHSQPKSTKSAANGIALVAIAASTGGPGALATILGSLPADFPVPLLVVQHVTSGFGQGLANWLDSQTALSVGLARHAQPLTPGEVLIAPDDYHMTINNLGLIMLNKQPATHGLRPAADYLFQSIAKEYGPTAVGVILTGMGGDGAVGLRAMRDAGARTIAQDESSCVVFGMPAVAIKVGAAEHVQPLPQIAKTLVTLVEEQQI
jgi:two-component system chemotaxis response regulator CheB